jgi:hypothetical protein
MIPSQLRRHDTYQPYILRLDLLQWKSPPALRALRAMVCHNKGILSDGRQP